MDKNQQVIEEFETMRDTAELNTLSRISLERPLTDREYERIMTLKKRVFS